MFSSLSLTETTAISLAPLEKSEKYMCVQGDSQKGTLIKLRLPRSLWRTGSLSTLLPGKIPSCTLPMDLQVPRHGTGRVSAIACIDLGISGGTCLMELSSALAEQMIKS